MHNPQLRTDALAAVVDHKLEMTHTPDGIEQDAESESDHEEDSEADELDITQQRVFGVRGARLRTQTAQFGYQIATSQIAMTEDSDS